MRLLVILALLGSLPFASVAQQSYRWVDKDGKVHYTQTPPPPGAAKNVAKKSFSAGAEPTRALPYATQVAMKNAPVTLYTAPDCGTACSEGRKYLNERGVPHKEVSVTDAKGVEELTRASGKGSVPVLLVGRDAQSGFETTAWKAALDAAGYPASAPPLQQRPAAAKPKPAPEADAGEKLPVSLYTSAGCGVPCGNARELLASRGVQFQEVVVESPMSFDELNKISGGSTLPVLVVGKAVQRGFEESLYNSALDAAGYARRPQAKP